MTEELKNIQTKTNIGKRAKRLPRLKWGEIPRVRAQGEILEAKKSSPGIVTQTYPDY